MVESTRTRTCTSPRQGPLRQHTTYIMYTAIIYISDLDTEEAGWINRGEVASGVGVGQFLRGLAKEIGYKAHTDFEGRLAAPKQTEQQDSAASEASGTAAVTMEVEQGGSAAPAATGAAAAVTGTAAAAAAATGTAAATAMEAEQDDSEASAAMEAEQEGSAASAMATKKRGRSAATRRAQGKRRRGRRARRGDKKGTARLTDHPPGEDS